ncbi:MAG: hypothetical protein AAF750_06505 [Planctomycetota bacterium]
MLDYLAQGFLLLATLVAIFGKTLDENKTGFKRITRWGLVAFCIAVLGFFVGLMRETATHREAEEDSNFQEEVRAVISELRYGELIINFRRRGASGVELTLANEGSEVIVVSSLTLHWDFSECQSFRAPAIGSEIIPFEYKFDITPAKGSVPIDPKDFKYANGDIDYFLIDLNLPEKKGIYTFSVRFTATRINNNTHTEITTQTITHDLCVKDHRPKVIQIPPNNAD